MKRLITALTLFAAPAFAGERLLITDVRLAEDLEAPRVSLLLEHGRITFIRTERNVSIPGVRSYSGEGRWITPAFIDAWTSSGVNAPEIVTDRDRKPDVSAEIMAEMRTANRKGIRAGFSAAETLSFNDDELSGVRKSGFGTLHVAPSGELLGGKSAVISASEAAARDQVIAEGVYQCAAFGASGTGYPSTLMGYHAQLRQFFLDASWNADLSVRLDEGRPGPRPSFDGDLSEGEVILRGERRLLCEAETDDDILRWLRLKDEWQTKGWDVQIAIVGGREAWRVADVLREREIPVILTLNWGDEVKDPDKGKDKDKDRDEEEVEDVTGDAEEMTTEEDVQVEPVELGDDEPGSISLEEETEAEEDAESEEDAEKDPSSEYTEPLAVQREKRARWLEGRDCALRLYEAGVPFAFGSGKNDSKKMLEKVRTLVKEGLPAEAALSSLTTGAAALLELKDRVGAVEEGYVANLCIWDGGPTTKKPRLAAMVVDGVIEEFDLEEEKGSGEAPEEDLEIDGSWTFEYSEARRGSTSMTIKMGDDGAVTGEVTLQNPFMEEPRTQEIKGRVSGRTLSLSAELDIEGFKVEIEYEGEVSGSTYEGTATWTFSRGSQEGSFTAKRAPEGLEEVQR
jgi:hypothetical protein